MVEVVLKLCAFVCVMVATRAAILLPGGSPSLGGTSNPGSTFQINTDQEPSEENVALNVADTADIGQRIQSLNESVEALSQQSDSAGTCECSGTEASSTNEAAIAALKSSVSALDTVCVEQTSSLDAISQSVTTVSGAVSGQDFSSDVAEMESQLQGFQGSFDSVSSQLQAAIKNGARQHYLNEANENVDSMNTELTELTDKVSSCTTQCSSAATSAEDSISLEDFQILQTSVHRLQDRVRAAEESTEGVALTTDVDNLEERIKYEEDTVSAHAQSISDLQTSLADDTTDISTIQTAVSGAQASLANIEANMVDVSSLDSVQEAVDAMEQTLTETSSATSAGETTLSTLEQRIDDTETKISDMQSQFTSSIGENQQLREDVDHYQTEANTIQSAASSLESVFTSMLTETRASIGSLAVDVEALPNSPNIIESRISTASNSIGNLEDKVQQLSGDLTKHNGKMSQVYEGIDATRWEMANYDYSSDMDSMTEDTDKLDQALFDIEYSLKPNCPDFFTLNTDHNLCYHIMWQALTWVAANRKCRAYGAGKGRLIVLDNDQKRQLFVNELWWYPYDTFWVGLYTISLWPSKYAWIGGLTKFDTEWNPGEPNGWDYMCGHLWDGTSTGHRLDDTSCDGDRYYICEVPM